MKTVALLGYKGFVGRAIYQQLQKAGYKVTGVSIDTHAKLRSGNYDIVINSAMPSKKYWALQHPVEDFTASAQFTATLLSTWRWKKFVQISTISSRCQLDHPYGINRFCAENLVLASSPDALVFRLGALYGEGLDKGVLFDMFSGNKVFLHGDSAYNYLSTTKAAKLMARQLPKTGIVEIGARDQITLKAIAEHFRLKVKFGKRVENLYTENPLSTYPRAKEVLDFVAAQKKK